MTDVALRDFVAYFDYVPEPGSDGGCSEILATLVEDLKPSFCRSRHRYVARRMGNVQLGSPLKDSTCLVSSNCFGFTKNPFGAVNPWKRPFKSLVRNRRQIPFEYDFRQLWTEEARVSLRRCRNRLQANKIDLVGGNII